MNKKRSILLTPDWKSWFWYWLLSLLLLPVFGIGLFLAVYAHRRRTAVTFEVLDRSLIRKTREGDEKIDLADIQSTNVHQTRIEERLGTGTVLLYVGSRMIEMPGMKDPDHLSGVIRQAAEAERNRISRKRDNPEPKPAPDPGTLDKMDYLTGLWQQGLISDDDFRNEKRHFE